MTGPRSGGSGPVVAFFLMAAVVITVLFVAYNAGLSEGRTSSPCPAVSR